MQSAVPQAIADAIADPKAYALGQPADEAFAWLRANAPFAQVQPTGYDPVWVVTRHADLGEIELRPDLWCSGANMPILTPRAVLDAREGDGFTGNRTLVSMDPPDHSEFRRLTQTWFMPKNLKTIEDRIRGLARDAVDRMVSLGGSCDFAREIALYYPLRVIMEILGMPPEDEPLMIRLTQDIFGTRDADLSSGGMAAEDPVQAQAALQKTMIEMQAYFTELTLDRRRRPTADLASTVANGVIHGEPISMGDAIGYYIISATAGHDTTSNTTSAAMWALAERPALLARLKAEPELVRPFIDEAVRWATVVKHFMRTATQDVEFAGQQVRKGDLVMLSYHSANRDEAVFDRPLEFDIDRSPNRHVAYGHGPHKCLGQHLANMEMRVFWEELLPRLDSVELNGEPKRTEANFVSGPKSVPISYRLS